MKRDYHIHSSWCGDCSTPAEDMVRSAIEKGMEEIGISGHSHTSFDESYCMSVEDTQGYIREINSLKEKYRDRISLKLGLEMDRFSDADPGLFDYVIGSVHYIRLESDIYIPIDESPEILKKAAETYFDGDMISLAEKYFETVSEVAEATNCRIIGHFDLICKFNGKGELFSEDDPRYIAAWKKAVDRLLPYGIPFEINTGAVSRGYRDDPYPSKDIREYIRSRGGSFILSSDSHSPDTIAFAFDEYKSYVI